MARRNRGTAATRAQTGLNGWARTSNGPGTNGPETNGPAAYGSGASEADEPGARTIGAMALQRWAARDPGAAPRSSEAAPARTSGPYDVDDVDPAQAAVDRVDFGAVRLPVPPGGEVTVEPEEGRLQAVHVMLAAGRLSVSALAAPRSDRLWPDLAREIDESLRDGGATVRSFTGEWGRELHARTGEASSVFVGVDGPRWMLYGVATGPTSATAELDAVLRRMLRGTVVVRGRAPYPVRTVLPLTVPAHLGGVPVGRPAGLDETGLVPPVRAGAEPGRADDSTGLLPPAVDGDRTDPRGLPRVPPAGRGAGGSRGASPVPDDAEFAAGRGDRAAPAAGRNGASRNGVPRNGAPRNDGPRNGGPRNGVFRKGRAEDGAGRTGHNAAVANGAGYDEAARDRSPGTKAPDAGNARTSKMPARPPQRRVADLLAEAERERDAAARSAREPAPPAPPRRPEAPPRWSERAAPAAEVGPAPSADGPPARWRPEAGWRPAVSHPTPPARAGYPAAEPAGWPPDDRETPLYLGGPGAVDHDRTAVGDVPLYREVAEGVAHRVDRAGHDSGSAPTGVPPAGSEDWTVPIPVIRPEPEPPRGRRARRGRETWTDDARADPWSGEERAEGRHGGQPADRDRRAAGRYRGAEQPGWPTTRSAPAHARPANRWPEPFDRTPDGRHHRPGE